MYNVKVARFWYQECFSPPWKRTFSFWFESPTTDSSGQTLYETTSGGRKFSKCSDLKFSTKVQNAASNLLLLHTMLYLSRHQFNFAIKANILLFLLIQFATKGLYALGRLKWILDIIWPLNQHFKLKNQRNWLNKFECENFGMWLIASYCTEEKNLLYIFIWFSK